MTSIESKNKLIAGNGRFVSGKMSGGNLGMDRIRDLSENGQQPFALVVSCSDSRIPPELVFDQGLGDLFVVRTAGNVVDDVALGSIEYGSEHLGIPLIVVLGHEKCGAVKATVDSCGGEGVHGCIRSITEVIKKSMDKTGASDNVYEACTDENIRNTIEGIKKNAVVAELLHAGKTEVIGAKYGINDGKVTFWE